MALKIQKLTDDHVLVTAAGRPPFGLRGKASDRSTDVEISEEAAQAYAADLAMLESQGFLKVVDLGAETKPAKAKPAPKPAKTEE